MCLVNDCFVVIIMTSTGGEGGLKYKIPCIFPVHQGIVPGEQLGKTGGTAIKSAHRAYVVRH